MPSREERERRRAERLAAERAEAAAQRHRLILGYVVAGVLALAVVAGLIAVIAYLRAALRSLDRGEVRPASSVAGVVAEMVKPAE